MKIEKTENPLRQKVILSESEKHLLKQVIEGTQAEEVLYEAQLKLGNKEFYNLEQGINVLNRYVLENEKTREAQVKETLDCYVEELSSGMHGGDCTAIACSCVKCYAEYLVGIDTVPGMSKSVGSIVFFLFKEQTTTLKEAIDSLQKSLEVSTNEAGRKEQEKALAWLKKYEVELKKEQEKKKEQMKQKLAERRKRVRIRKATA